jgi:hypothetical protein
VGRLRGRSVPLRPERAFAWADFPADATRWTADATRWTADATRWTFER